MITRKIGKLLRGKATPFQIILAAVLGSMIGFIPGFWNGPGLTIALLLILIIFNANLVVAGLVGLVSKLLCYISLPVSFSIGQFLLEGPLEPMFRKLINAPVLALFGFEHYATTGGTLLGLIFGVVSGIVLVSLVQRFRRKMSQYEQTSERYKEWSSKWWVKLLAFIFVGGGHGKKTYEQLLSRKVGNPFRVLGVIFAVLVVVFIIIGYQFLSGPVVTMAMQRGLENANGATVDIDNAELDLTEGKVMITGLAMADPNALDTDILRAKELTANISTKDLLRKRLTLDQLVVRDATSGDKRARPGELIKNPPQPSDAETAPGEKTIDDYIDQAKQWKQRLAQLREWMEKISGPPADEDDESWQDRIKRRAEEIGYARVIAQQLIEAVPTLTITDLQADGVKVAYVEGEVFDVHGENLSTQPYLLGKAPSIKITSRSGKIGGAFALNELNKPAENAKSASATTPTNNSFQFKYLGLPAEKLKDTLQIGGKPLLNDGTIDINIDGSFTAKGIGHIDLPLQVTLHDTTIQVPSVKPTKVSQLLIPIGLRGPMDNPGIALDDQSLADALFAAGATELANRAQAEADKQLGKVQDKLEEEIGDKVGEEGKEILDKAGEDLGKDVGGAIKDILGGKKKQDEPK